MNVKVQSIINHGSVIQIIGKTRRGSIRSIVGDHRPIRDAIEGLGICVGSVISVDVDDEGNEFIGEAA